MNKYLPWPRLSVGLLLIWLLLNQSLSLGHILLGSVFAVVLPIWTLRTRTVDTHPGRPARPLVAIRLLLIVMWDSFVSNIDVSRIILSRRMRRANSGFLKIPLELKDPYGIGLLVTIITSIPGTVCTELSDDRTVLTLHVLNLDDEAYWINLIKSRYETPLREIFE
ncbi:MAG: Na+/H+ antiporter subunit E [Pigmentiphaga sp.]|nr:Na+/H+ antiporter subunit E [Pigmentiphaga sp.]